MQHIDFAFHMDQDAKDLHANRWTLQDKTTSIYGTLEQFVLEVVTVPCTRNNFVHLTSFFEALLVNCNTSIKHRMVPSTGIKFSTTGKNEAEPSHKHLESNLRHIVCVGSSRNSQRKLQISLNIAAAKNSCLESICSIPMVGKEATRGIIKVRVLVDTQVCDHGWRQRNATITGGHFCRDVRLFFSHGLCPKRPRLLVCRY